MKKIKNIIITVIITIIALCALFYWIGSKDEEPSSLSNNATISNSSTTNASTKYPNTFNDDELGFSVVYPADWEYTRPDATTVVFSGKEDTEAYYSTVNVQSIASKNAGGKYATTEELTNNLKAQFLSAPQAEILEEGTSTLTQADGTKYEGKYLIVTYLPEGQDLIKQEQKIFPRKDGLGFYAWAYTSPEDQYDKYSPIAESILEQIHFSK